MAIFPNVDQCLVEEGNPLPQGEDLLEYLCNWLDIGDPRNNTEKCGAPPATTVSLAD